MVLAGGERNDVLASAEEAREEAREIAKEDPSLIFLPTYTITTECGSTEITTESVDKAAADFASREGWKNISDVEALADKWMRKGTTFAVNGDDGYHFQARA